jgi:hypothetical protein
MTQKTVLDVAHELAAAHRKEDPETTLVVEPVPRLVRGLLRFSGRESIDTVHGFVLLWWCLLSILQRAFRR